MKFILIALFVSSCAGTMKPKFDGFYEVPSVDQADKESRHYQVGNQHVFISLMEDKLSQEEAERLFTSRNNYLKSLFKNDKDPYFGKTSKTSSCLSSIDLNPKLSSYSKSQYVTYYLPATENYVLGQCNSALENTEAEISFIYCKELKKFYEMKYYRPSTSKALLLELPGEICEM